jgi:hypothetical protein
MIDIIDAFHYLIGIIIVVFLLWCFVQVHNYFSKDNIPIFVNDKKII